MARVNLFFKLFVFVFLEVATARPLASGPKCGQKVDVIFLLDSSTSVGPDNWKLQLNFLVDLTRPLAIGPKAGRVALATFNTRSKIEFGFDKHTTAKSLHAAIKKTTFSEGLTFTGEALHLILTRLVPKMRRNVPKLLILVTDGRSNGEVKAWRVAEKIKEKGVTIFTVGITNQINRQKLARLSSHGKVLTADTMNKLQTLVPTLNKQTCKVIVKPTCKGRKVDIVFVLDSSTSVGPDNWMWELKFITDVTRPVSIGPHKGRVALVTFNTAAKLQFDFEKYSNSRALRAAIMSTKFSEGLTFTGEALDLVLDKLVPKMRSNIPKLLFLITDGKANGEKKPVAVAKRLKRRGVNIFAVGVTKSIDRKELLKLSSKKQLLMAKAPVNLRSLLPEIQEQACKAVKNPRCKGKKLDMVFVLDSSTSVGPDAWKIQLNFLIDLTRPLSIGPKTSRVALVTFNTDAKVQVDFDSYKDKEALHAAIRSAKFSEGLTFTGRAMRLVLEKLWPKMRKGVPKLLFLVTDGKNNGLADPALPSDALKSRGVRIFTVGITNAIDKKKLMRLSSDRKVLTVNSVKNLRSLLPKLQRTTCQIAKTTRPLCKHQKLDVVFLLDSSTSVGPDNWKIQLNFLITLTQPLTIAANAARVALVTFNTHAKLEFDFSKHKSGKSLRKAIKRTKFSEGLTFTGEALNVVLKKLVPKMRSNVPKLLFVVTDGKSNGEMDPVKEASKIKEKGVSIYTIGITKDINRKELALLSSQGKVLKVKTVGQLNSLAPTLQKKTCGSLKKPECKGKKVDLVFVLDSSTSVGPQNWKRELSFLVDLTRPLTIGVRRARVALVTYNTKVKLNFHFNRYWDRRSLHAAIKKTKFSEGITFTGEALELVLKQLVPRMRKDVPKVVILVTDGKSNGEVRPETVAPKIRAKGVKIFVVGIADVNRKELKMIADKGSLYEVAKPQNLKELVLSLQRKTCKVVKKTK